MSTPEEFAAECKAAARALRRVPADLRRALGSQVKAQVAMPLGAKISGAATGPWAAPLAASVKVRSAADPTIVIGGSRKVVSGGANARQLVFGAEFGGGKRTGAVLPRRRQRAYKRATTNQFTHHHTPFVFSTIANNYDWVLDRFADIVDDVLGEALDG